MKYTVLLLICYIQSVAQTQIHLWPNGAPGFEARKDEPEQAKDWWVKNIHNPSITVYQPATGTANGTAVLICPGGGHRELVFNPEGKDAAAYFNSIGVTAFVLKYRLAREENSPYLLDVHPRQDVNRAMRMIRSKAAEWHLMQDKIGVMGFSAGGEVAAMVAYSGGSILGSMDSIDLADSRPNFQILIYPGPYGIPETVPDNAPATFMLVANDDPCCSQPVVDLLSKYRKAKRPIEAHIYAQGSHAFNMGLRSKLRTLHSWPDRLTDWMIDNGWVKE
ncbi:MAG: alpha/beta hydrolase [Saprospiraceae bacterium]|nr:alpha/beta hydrolase [Saprospiraceae bacterium]MBK8510989.1 alpha/beta hydrolase [Saprospiraceae bacterium]MBK8777905.1 alpha/beta hydrolase [Saprospiraceae bacterium]MBP7921169.1 alpha/beta hydrolase [Saprospiraceae bacterium]